MGFLDEVRATLRRPPGLSDASEQVPEALVERCRRVVFEELGAMAPGWRLGQAFERFSERDALLERVRFAWRAAAAGPFGPAAEPDRIDVVVDALLAHLRGVSDAPATFRDREVRRLADRFEDLGWRDPIRYLVELGALEGTGSARTRLGDLLLQLGVRELTVALLHAEALQSTGRDDGRRLPRWVFASLARGSALNADDFPPWPDLSRLEALGLLDVGYHGELEYVDDRRPWLADAADEQSPLGLLVQSALEDDAQLRIQPHGVAPGSERAVRDLAELVSHELGNALAPLGITLGQLSLELPPDHRHLVRLRELTDRLRTFARSIAQLSPGAEPVTEIELLDLVQDVLARAAPERNGHLVVSLEIREVRFSGRRARLRLALENLVRNAAQAAQGAERPVTLTVRGGAVAGAVSVVVEDDGPGVPPAIVDVLFERGTSGEAGPASGSVWCARCWPNTAGPCDTSRERVAGRGSSCSGRGSERCGACSSSTTTGSSRTRSRRSSSVTGTPSTSCTTRTR